MACPNGDTAPLEEQASTGLAWALRSLRVLPEDGATPLAPAAAQGA